MLVRGSKQGLEQRLNRLETNVLRLAVGQPLLTAEQVRLHGCSQASIMVRACWHSASLPHHSSSRSGANMLVLSLPCSLDLPQLHSTRATAKPIRQRSQEQRIGYLEAEVQKMAQQPQQSLQRIEPSSGANQVQQFKFDALAVWHVWATYWWPVLVNQGLEWLGWMGLLAVNLNTMWCLLHPEQGDGAFIVIGLVGLSYLAVIVLLFTVNATLKLVADVQHVNEEKEQERQRKIRCWWLL